MWVNKKDGERKKHQYFGHFSGKKLIKMNKNIEESSGTLRLHSATSGNKNE